MDITENTFVTTYNVNHQLISKDGADFMFPGLGRKIVDYINEDKLTISKEDFIVYIHVKFVPESKYEEVRKLYKKDE